MRVPGYQEGMFGCLWSSEGVTYRSCCVSNSGWFLYNFFARVFNSKKAG